MSQHHHYNLRHKTERESPQRDRDSTEEEEGDDFEEDSQSPRQQYHDRNTSNMSQSDSSSRQWKDYDSSTLSSTCSESFSFHSGRSPKPAKGKLYPSLPTDGSPQSRRREVHKRSPRSSPKNLSPHRSSGKNLSRDESPKPSQNQTSVVVFCVVAILCLLLCLIVPKLLASTPQIHSDDNNNSFNEFKTKVDELKEKFPEQNSRFWKTIKSSVTHVFDPEVRYPAVLLMVSGKEHANLAASISEAVAQVFEDVMHGEPSVKMAPFNLTSSLGKHTADEQKLKVDNWLKEKFDGAHKAVVLHHLEFLLPEAALLLHGYCDGDNAPYKKAMLILGLYLDKQADSAQTAELALKNLWISQLSEDKVGALLSRVANNIVLLTAPSK